MSFLECGTFRWKPNNSTLQKNTLKMKYNVMAIAPSFVPFAQSTGEEILFKSCKTLGKDVIVRKILTTEDYEKPFSVDLPIEQTYSVESRFQWNMEEPGIHGS